MVELEREAWTDFQGYILPLPGCATVMVSAQPAPKHQMAARSLLPSSPVGWRENQKRGGGEKKVQPHGLR